MASEPRFAGSRTRARAIAASLVIQDFNPKIERTGPGQLQPTQHLDRASFRVRDLYHNEIPTHFCMTGMQSLHILLAGLLMPLLSSCGAQGSHPQDPTASQLEVQGAGNTTVNGHYSVNGSLYGHPLFVKTGSVEQLYFYDGYWRFGVAGEVVLYVACYESATPFVQFCGSGSGWGVSPPPTILIPTPAVGDLTFEDNFSDPVLNRSKWNVLEQVHRGGVYTAENVYVENGQLVLRTIAQNITPADDRMAEMFYESSGAVNTSNLFSQRYGKWEARVKLPDVDATPGYVGKWGSPFCRRWTRRLTICLVQSFYSKIYTSLVVLVI